MMQWYVRRRLTTPLSLYLCGFYCVVFVVAAVIPQVGDILLLFPDRVVHGWEIWRLLTYGMFSISLLSLLLLVITILWFGAYLEPALTSRRYLALYVVPHTASAVLIMLMRMGSLEGLPYAGSFIAASGVWAAFVAWAIAHIRSTNWRVRSLVLPVAYFLWAILLAPWDIIGIHVVAWIAGVVVVFPALRKSVSASSN